MATASAQQRQRQRAPSKKKSRSSSNAYSKSASSTSFANVRDVALDEAQDALFAFNHATTRLAWLAPALDTQRLRVYAVAPPPSPPPQPSQASSAPAAPIAPPTASAPLTLTADITLDADQGRATSLAWVVFPSSSSTHHPADAPHDPSAASAPTSNKKRKKDAAATANSENRAEAEAPPPQSTTAGQQFVALGMDDGTVRLYSPLSGALARILTTLPTNSASAAASSSSSSAVAVGGSSERSVVSIDQPRDAPSTLLAASADGTVSLWRLDGGALDSTSSSRRRGVEPALTFRPDVATPVRLVRALGASTASLSNAGGKGAGIDGKAVTTTTRLLGAHHAIRLVELNTTAKSQDGGSSTGGRPARVLRSFGGHADQVTHLATLERPSSPSSSSGTGTADATKPHYYHVASAARNDRVVSVWSVVAPTAAGAGVTATSLASVACDAEVRALAFVQARELLGPDVGRVDGDAPSASSSSSSGSESGAEEGDADDVGEGGGGYVVVLSRSGEVAIHDATPVVLHPTRATTAAAAAGDHAKAGTGGGGRKSDADVRKGGVPSLARVSSVRVASSGGGGGLVHFATCGGEGGSSSSSSTPSPLRLACVRMVRGAKLALHWVSLVDPTTKRLVPEVVISLGATSTSSAATTNGETGGLFSSTAGATAAADVTSAPATQRYTAATLASNASGATVPSGATPDELALAESMAAEEQADVEGLDEPSLAQRLKSLKLPANAPSTTKARQASRGDGGADDEDGDDEDVEDEDDDDDDDAMGSRAGRRGKWTTSSTSRSKLRPADAAASSSVTLSSSLVQALHSSDEALLSSVLNHARPSLVRDTVRRLSGPMALRLLEAVVERLSRGGGGGGGGGRGKRKGKGMGSQKARGLIEWVRACLLLHAAYFMSIPNLTARLATLHAAVQERLADEARLLALHGRLELVVAQIELRTRYAAASRGGGGDEAAGKAKGKGSKLPQGVSARVAGASSARLAREAGDGAAGEAGEEGVVWREEDDEDGDDDEAAGRRNGRGASGMDLDDDDEEAVSEGEEDEDAEVEDVGLGGASADTSAGATSAESDDEDEDEDEDVEMKASDDEDEDEEDDSEEEEEDTEDEDEDEDEDEEDEEDDEDVADESSELGSDDVEDEDEDDEDDDEEGGGEHGPARGKGLLNLEASEGSEDEEDEDEEDE